MDKALQNTSKLSNASAISNSKSLVGDAFTLGNDKARVNAADIEKAVALIEQSFAVQQERIQIVVDAAVLALEQIQDKRLELSEKGKTVTIYDVIFDMLSLYLWEVGLMGHVLEPLVKEVTRAICSKSLKYSAVYNQLSKSDYGAELIGYARQEKNSKELLQEIIGDHVRNAKQFNSDEYAIFSKEARQMVSSAPDVVWKKATGAIAKWKDTQEKVKEMKLEMTDTPGVSMLKAAQSYVSSHRFALKLQQARIVAFIRSQTSITVKELRDLLSIFVIEELPNTDFIRDQYQWTFELIIWARMYGFQKDEWKSPEVHTNSDKGFEGIRQEVTYYWFERFRDILAAFGEGRGKDWERLTIAEKTWEVRKYFSLVLKKMDEKSKKTGPIEAAFQVSNSNN
ncbi:hypothetical protein ACFPPD_21260 [Cohnella suwonensis]|uniref:Uncharacterized protein n=1 Tax=Cohnella suwonensis TaxID=696072 RepID=A0ABW0M119_9BACL